MLIPLVGVAARLQYRRVIKISDKGFVMTAEQPHIGDPSKRDDVWVIRSAAFLTDNRPRRGIDIAIGNSSSASSTVKFQQNAPIPHHFQIFAPQLAAIDEPST